MRTPLLAGLLALLIPACTDGISDIGGAGDDTGGAAVCGNGSMEAGEACDDSNTNNGDGCSSSCQTENTAVPRVVIALDKTTLTSDLNVENTVTVTLTSMMGFTGDVTLAASAVDGSTALSDWAAGLNNTTVTLAADQTATATLTVRAMGDVGALTGNVKVTATSTAAEADASVAVTFNPVLRIAFTDENGACGYSIAHNTVPNAWKIKAGRQIAIVNPSATLGMTVHTDNTIEGFPHESGSTAPGAAYTRTVTAAGQTSSFYCHNPGNGDATLLKQGVSQNYQQLTTVP